MVNVSACGIPNFAMDDSNEVTVQFKNNGTDTPPFINFPTKLTPPLFWEWLAKATKEGHAVRIIVSSDDNKVASDVHITVF